MKKIILITSVLSLIVTNIVQADDAVLGADGQPITVMPTVVEPQLTADIKTNADGSILLSKVNIENVYLTYGISMLTELFSKSMTMLQAIQAGQLDMEDFQVSKEELEALKLKKTLTLIPSIESLKMSLEQVYELQASLKAATSEEEKTLLKEKIVKTALDAALLNLKNNSEVAKLTLEFNKSILKKLVDSGKYSKQQLAYLSTVLLTPEAEISSNDFEAKTYSEQRDFYNHQTVLMQNKCVKLFN